MWYFVLLMGVIFIIVLFSTINVNIKYTLREKEDSEPNTTLNLATPETGIRISFLWGLFAFRLRLSSAKLVQKSFDPVLKLRARLFGRSNSPLVKEKISLTLVQALLLSKQMKQIYRATVPAYRYLLEGVKLHRFSWRTGLGLYEADQTGIAVSILWMVKSNATAFLYHMLKKSAPAPRLEIIPVFSGRILKMQFNCVFSVRISRIVFTGIMAGWLYKKNKKIFKN